MCYPQNSIILYDASGKASGVCAKAFDYISMLLIEAADTIKTCGCEEGCPACVASPICSGANTIVSKLGALIVLESILGRKIDLDSIPTQPPIYGRSSSILYPSSTPISIAGKEYRSMASDARRSKIAAGRETSARRGVMEEEEIGAEEAEAREAALRELMGG